MKKCFKLMALLAMGAALAMTACGKDDDKGKDDNPTGPAGVVKETFTAGGVSFDMVLVKAGTFTMGALEGDEEADGDETRHTVTLTRDYYIGATEVTQELYAAVMGSNPSGFTEGENLPVETVSHNDAVAFCGKLSEMTGKTFALPTEAQWEYAARGGHKAPATATLYAGGDDIEAVAWYGGNSDSKTHAVGTKAPNALGLYDMSGNVWEWCADWYGDYSADAVTDPAGPSTGSNRVLRGGSWFNSARICRASFRDYYYPINRSYILGFRVVLVL
ncbi:MAG: SUMF1/EgtB/PvdO family nonheme iron enzyme [Bacteroidales bacterium]|nr:SUMF1/EgtB/PvdO family nonheme iron enzyme [Bacteroidales bacterium]